ITMMIVALFVIVVLSSGADAVPCDGSSTCEDASCYFALLNNSLFHAGCASDEPQPPSCFTQGQRRVCACSSDLCNNGSGSFKKGFMSPVLDIDLNTFFETVAAIVPSAPVAAASTEKTPASTAEAAKEITSAAPADVVATSTETAKDDSSEESSDSPAIDTNTTATTPKPNSGSAAPFLIAAAFFGTALLF
ncbi:hypothetical protein PRIPAC_90080, partial [Pristionchus pacificus]|uniref:Uncharacterized protein n=1 Tax=Pristionchus pacificus TaxID=54126 RepID=A0A2A6CVK1_PRIPA